MNKRGISAVVATVLIILITIAAVTIIWAVVLPMIRDSISGVDFSSDISISTSEGFTAYDLVSHRLCVQVSRGTDNSDITSVQFIASSEGDSYMATIGPAPAKNQMKIYCFNTSGLGGIDSISVAPVVMKGTSKKVGAITGKLENVPSGDLSEHQATYYNFSGEDVQCTPNCDGKVCGSNGCGGSCGPCGSGESCENGQCVSGCVPDCPDASSVACGEDVTPSNNCGSCSGKGSYCDSGYSCQDGSCVSLCTPESNETLCSNAAQTCGNLIVTDSCGYSRTIDCGGCSSGYDCVDGSCVNMIPSGLVAYWKGENNANDELGLHDGNWIGSGIGYSAGRNGKGIAFSFNGNGNVNIPSSTIGLSPITISAWINRASVADRQVGGTHVVGGAANGGIMWIDDKGNLNKLCFGKNRVDGLCDVSGMLLNQTNTWYYTAITYSGSSICFYINGEPKSCVSYGTTFSSTDYGIGGLESSPSNRFLGSIDEVMIFNRSLSASEIQNLYNYQN